MGSLFQWSNANQYNLLPFRSQKDEARQQDGVSTKPTSRQMLQHICSKRSWSIVIVITLVLAIVTLFSSSSLEYSSTDARLPSLYFGAGQKSGPQFDSYMGDVDFYIRKHPHTFADSTTFAQMGMFTRLYARLLQDSSASLDLLTSYESSLWFFAPGVTKIRNQYMSDFRSKQNKQNRGIVMSVGSGTFLFANHLISTIRQVHKSQMPIEIFFRDEGDLPSNLQSYFSSTYSNIYLTSLTQTGIFDDSIADMGGWSIKPFALFASRFSEVILADADTIFLTPPEDFFEQDDYKNTGTLFFSDRDVPRKYDETKDERIREWLLQQMGHSNPEPSESLANSFFWQHKGIYRQESGIVLLDKRRTHVFAALLFSAWQNIRAIRDKVTYDLFWGDKETFWLAFELAGLPYYMNNHGAGSIGSIDDINSPIFCVEHPLHFFEAPEGSSTLTNMKENPPMPKGRRPLSRPAWMNGSMRKNKINRESKEFIDLNSALWSMDGIWFWGEEARLNCQRDFTHHSMDEFNLKALFIDLQKTAKDAEDKAQRYLDSH